MQHDPLMHIIQNEEVLIPLLITLGIVVGIVTGTIGKTIRGVARERTKREIAAYIAEGSMSPEQGERILRSGGDRS